MVFLNNVKKINKLFQIFSWVVFVSGSLKNDDFKIESIELTTTKRRYLDNWRIAVSEISEDVEDTLENTLRIIILQCIDEIVTLEHRYNLRDSDFLTLHKLCVKIMMNLITKIYTIKSEPLVFGEEEFRQYISRKEKIFDWAQNLYFLKTLMNQNDINFASYYGRSVRYRSGIVWFTHYNCTELFYDCFPPELEREILAVFPSRKILSKDLKFISHDQKLEKKIFENKEIEIKDFDSIKARIKLEQKKLNNNFLKLKINIRMNNPIDTVNFNENPMNYAIVKVFDHENLISQNLLKNYNDGIKKLNLIMCSVFSNVDRHVKLRLIVNLDQSLYYRHIIKKGIKYYNSGIKRQIKCNYSFVSQIKMINNMLNEKYYPEFFKIVDKTNEILHNISILSGAKVKSLNPRIEDEEDSMNKTYSIEPKNDDTLVFRNNEVNRRIRGSMIFNSTEIEHKPEILPNSMKNEQNATTLKLNKSENIFIPRNSYVHGKSVKISETTIFDSSNEDHTVQNKDISLENNYNSDNKCFNVTENIGIHTDLHRASEESCFSQTMILNNVQKENKTV